MKKISSIFGILLTAIFAVAGFASCSNGVYYENADKYAAGGATLTQTISNLDIEWTLGSVEILHGDVEGITFSETAKVSLSERTSLHYWLDGETLRIHYAQSSTGIHFGAMPSKALTVTLPRDCTLTILDLEVISTDVFLREVGAQTIEVDNVSGEIEATMSALTKRMEMESVSGNVTLTNCQAEHLEVDSTSGNVHIETQATPKEGSIENVSGNVTMTFIEGTAGFTLEVETVSGTFYSALPMTSSGKKHVYGDGSHSLEIETTSGNVRLEQK